jgi:hypothetical protein
VTKAAALAAEPDHTANVTGGLRPSTPPSGGAKAAPDSDQAARPDMDGTMDRHELAGSAAFRALATVMGRVDARSTFSLRRGAALDAVLSWLVLLAFLLSIMTTTFR